MRKIPTHSSRYHMASPCVCEQLTLLRRVPYRSSSPPRRVHHTIPRPFKAPFHTKHTISANTAHNNTRTIPTRSSLHHMASPVMKNMSIQSRRLYGKTARTTDKRRVPHFREMRHTCNPPHRIFLIIIIIIIITHIHASIACTCILTTRAGTRVYHPFTRFPLHSLTHS
ncbi:hypothetical protein DFJ77DRAFT_471656 [Powellomyces hirtus]|nr:hypothetical protein DFJ77DRAFT_471656 [Powellomyces hirtus]